MIILERFAYTPIGTFGKLFYDDFTCYTVERPWLNNSKGESCIPEGDYDLVWHDSPKFGKTLAVKGGTVAVYEDGVAKRSAILIHPANVMDDLNGCIGLGNELGFYKQKWAVLNSKKTVADFLQQVPDNTKGIQFSIRQIAGAK